MAIFLEGDKFLSYSFSFDLMLEILMMLDSDGQIMNGQKVHMHYFFILMTN